jgi:hypothetical protein
MLQTTILKKNLVLRFEKARKKSFRLGLALISDGWRVFDDDYGQTVGKLQAESMMSTAASLFPQ